MLKSFLPVVESFSSSFYFRCCLRDGATGNIEAAKKVGLLVAERAKAAGMY
jgi:ribosomal protein L18